MKKILMVFEGDRFSEGAFAFAQRLNELQPILLTGIFLPQSKVKSLWSYAQALITPLTGSDEVVSDDKAIQKNLEDFTTRCTKAGIRFSIHKDYYDFALLQLKRESLYADLMIIGSEVFYNNDGKELQEDYLQDALHGMKCPVIVVPENYSFPASIILSYDGSEDAIYAIKQFAYLLPELTVLDTMLVYAGVSKDEEIPDQPLIQELAERSYPNLTICKLDVDIKKEFTSWVLNKTSAMLVSGAFGRSGLSMMLKKSFVNDIVAAHKLPVFIAHR